MHVVADGAYLCTELRRLPPHVALTGPLRSNANLWHVWSVSRILDSSSDLVVTPRGGVGGR